MSEPMQKDLKNQKKKKKIKTKDSLLIWKKSWVIKLRKFVYQTIIKLLCKPHLT